MHAISSHRTQLHIGEGLDLAIDFRKRIGLRGEQAIGAPVKCEFSTRGTSCDGHGGELVYAYAKTERLAGD